MQSKACAIGIEGDGKNWECGDVSIKHSGVLSSRCGVVVPLSLEIISLSILVECMDGVLEFGTTLSISLHGLLMALYLKGCIEGMMDYQHNHTFTHTSRWNRSCSLPVVYIFICCTTHSTQLIYPYFFSAPTIQY